MRGHHASWLNILFIGFCLIVVGLLIVKLPIFFIVMIQSWNLHISMIGILLALLLFPITKKWIFSSLVVGVFIFLFFYTLLITPTSKHLNQSTNQPDLSIYHQNVYEHNQNFETYLNKVNKHQPDILSIIEYTPSWHNNIHKEIIKTYPYYIYRELPNPFGIALYSKYPLLEKKILTHDGLPYLSGKIMLLNKEIKISAVHPPPPLYQNWLNVRNSFLKKCSKELGKNSNIILGDFNVVPWDHDFRDFLLNTKLMDSRLNYNGSFPSWLGSLGIPIDYILHSKDFSCTSYVNIKIEGSDHRGIYASLTI